jgi:hypothetical protein
MNANRMLAMEFMVAIGMTSWAAVKGDGTDKFWPWPPTVMLTGVAFGILGVLAIPQPRLASVLGGGFLLAQILRALGKEKFFDLSGIPKSDAFHKYNEKGPGGAYYRILTF